MEARAITVSLDTNNTVEVNEGAEQGNYVIEQTWENTTDGIAFKVKYETQLTRELEIDTAAHTVTDLHNGSNQFGALDPFSIRAETFPLKAGSTTVQITSPNVVSENCKHLFEV